MADTAGLNLNQPPKIDWDNYNPGSKYTPPPVPVGPDGKKIVFSGQVGGIKPTEDQENNRQYILDPIKLVKMGSGVDGYEIRFTFVGTQPFFKTLPDGTKKPLNASPVGNVLRAGGVTAKPQTVPEYDAAMNLVKGRVIQFTADWEARNKETGETVRGYENFPEDPERPGQRKAILKAGDTYTVRDRDGNVTETKTVQSEVLFANLKARFFVDPNRK